jgi:hypothetical protein
MLLGWIIGLAVLAVWYGSYWTIRKDDAESGMPGCYMCIAYIPLMISPVITVSTIFYFLHIYEWDAAGPFVVSLIAPGVYMVIQDKRKEREDAKEMKEKFLNMRGFGYEEMSLDDFLRLLKAYDTTVLVDVRGSSYPVPRKEFTHEMLSQALEKHDIKYVSLPALGINKYDAPNFWEYGKPEGETARKKYRNSLDSETARQALAYLRKLAQFNDSVALMCVESRDEECHRDVILQYLRENRNG